ncbi:GMC family oxidoreductase [Streptomyces sp. UNOC14_S4]|uniref:GMC family oxidoreductase n=1 Tax=Streptomyces sp. UNOC14_S4 TaxID=2872340 RepID=UPI001E5B264D|nr:GMC family oxidoreductase N-terminal domain-containing protein [Streptomyces sp. UNOC14_S4]MCC3770844.1 GMC family oxidoreductase N-terminal domain-containing protein [Streptomyces sp. UNOC14_S4]
MSKAEFDYVIVGAGSAGCALAARLSENPGTRVALVEAGGADTDPAVRIPAAAASLFGTAYDWGYGTVPQAGLGGRAVPWPRGRTLGGSSAVNFLMWVPGHAEDYDAWADASRGLWSWDAVRPFLHRAERWAGAPGTGEVYGTEGPLWISPPRSPDPSTARFLRACGELGLAEITGGLGGPEHTGCALTPLTERDGARWSAADGYLRPAMERGNLEVLTGEPVHRVLLEDGRATGVQLADRTLTARREVVLSAGTVGSAQLLMLSGIGDTEHLRAAGVRPRVHLPGVGRNLQDHVTVDVMMRATGPVPLADADTPANRELYERERRGPLSSNIAEAVAFVRTDGGPGAPDVELIWAPVADSEEVGGRGLTTAVVLLRPDSRGSITLAGADPALAPSIDPGYLSADGDVRTLMAGVRFAERLFGTESLRGLVDGPAAPWPGPVADDVLEGVVRERASTLFHPVGTCSMGLPDDEQAVVDPWLRVRGVEGLRVADASVIPRVPRGHTHAHAVMIGERAAELIRGAAG